MKAPENITVTLVEQGTRQRHGRTSSVVGRVYEVKDAEGNVLGYVTRKMFTRERKVAGRRYVTARWESPGWGVSTDRNGRYFEVASKRDGVEDLIGGRA